jgi:pimeloyl-ACP methyl ester carboxylesterase
VISSGHYAKLPNGISLHYARAGSGDAAPILLLHGFPEYWGAWEDLMPLLADEYQLVAPDLRGFNLSSQPLDVPSYRAREIVSDLELFCEHLGWDRITVVAHDWGGAVAWQWAIARPQRIARLVMLNSPHPIPFARALASNPAQQAASEYMNWLRAPGSETGLVKHDFAALEGFFLRMQRNDARWYTPKRALRYQEVWARGMTGGVNYYRASPLHPPIAGGATAELDPVNFHVRVPTLVLWGEADTALPASLLVGLEELIDDLTIQRLPRATHWLAHEEPDVIAAAIRTFIGRA